MNPKGQSCGNCRFYSPPTIDVDIKPEDFKILGLCRYNPPVVNQVHGVSHFAGTSGDDWCGKWESRA